MKFWKMNGAGNDFIIIDNRVEKIPHEKLPNVVKTLCERHLSIGADGFMVVEASNKADYRMLFFNSDGSVGEMCGNGARCVGKYLYEKGLTSKTEIKLDTLSGIKILKLNLGPDGKVSTVTVNMGKGLPLKVNHGDGTLVGEKLNVGEGPTICSAIDMGNPHLVMFVKDAENARVAEVGPLMEHHKMFPDRANIEFAQVLDRKHIRMRVWERGSGITFACGTGACATAVASAMQGYTDPDGCDVIMDGGTLTVSWNPQTKEVLMTGAAEFVFEGTVTE